MDFKNFNHPHGYGKGHTDHGNGHGHGHEHHCHIPCFTKDTALLTNKGEKLIQRLKVGDKILTRDNGFKEITWINKVKVTKPNKKVLPINVLGTLYSPNHRILQLVSSKEREVFDFAKNIGQVTLVDNVTYFHFTLDQHEVVLSNGMWTESFYISDYSLSLLDEDSKKELLELFPDKFKELARKVA